MDGAAELSLGQRVAVLRKLRGLTQEGLALRLNRSTSWVTKIERGARRIDSMAVLQELARALAVPVHQLTGRSDPAAMDGNSAAGDDLTELRRALDRIGAIAHGSSTEEPPRVDDLCQEAAALRQLYNTSARNFSAVVPLLAGLINEAQRAAVLASGHDRLAAYASLSAFYRIASLELRQRGDLTRARLAVDRALMAAEQADNGLLVASIAATMTVQLMIQGDPEDGVAVALDAADHARRQPNADTPPGMVVFGALYLYAAQAAARAQDSTGALRLLKVASEVSADLGQDREDYCLIFGPTNVAIQESGILVDLGEPTRAVQRAEKVRPERLRSVNRSGYHHLHLARAHGMRGKDQAAISAVMTAHRIARELVRHDPIARELVRDVARRRRRIDGQLRSLARNMNILLYPDQAGLRARSDKNSGS